nr:pilus assembly protein N-terminal domain-containing protein [Bradyrhizobium yuanmingense]
MFLAGPTIADHQVPSNTTIFVFGKSGPSLFALNSNGAGSCRDARCRNATDRGSAPILKAKVGESYRDLCRSRGDGQV